MDVTSEGQIIHHLGTGALSDSKRLRERRRKSDGRERDGRERDEREGEEGRK